MSKDTQIWSGSRWQCRMSISKHFQLRYLILKFFRSEAHRVPGRIRLSPRSPHPRRLSSQVPRERSDGQEGPGVLMQDAGLPGQVLGSPPPPSQAATGLWQHQAGLCESSGQECKQWREGPFLKPFPLRPCFKYFICINSLIFPTTH